MRCKRHLSEVILSGDRMVCRYCGEPVPDYIVLLEADELQQGAAPDLTDFARANPDSDSDLNITKNGCNKTGRGTPACEGVDESF